MNEFLYLFRGGDARAAQQSPEAMQAHMEKWKTWMEKLGKDGRLIGGKPLENSGKMVTDKGKVVTDGPYTEGKELVGGYLIVSANDLDHAVSISLDCPIHEANGSVEVRQIASLAM
jgi:hypothetical protein